MKIAISTDNGQVSAHFGRCPEFTIVEIENGAVKAKEVIQNPGHHPGFLPQFLHEQGVSIIIAGGMGARAQQIFAGNGIKAIMGVFGSIDSIVNDFLAGNLREGKSLCQPGAGKGYGLDKTACDHEDEKGEHC